MKEFFDLQRFVEKISLTAGDDNFGSEDENFAVYALGGNDTVTSSGKNVTVDGGKGNDYIKNYGANGLTYGGDGNDTITMEIVGVHSSVYAGKGDDTVHCWGGDDANYFYCDAGEGNNWIWLDVSNSTVLSGAGKDEIIMAAFGYGNNNFVNSGDGDDSMEIIGSLATVYGGTGNDAIINYASKSIIYGEKGNDSITNFGGAQLTIEAGTGNDNIYNTGSQARINMGDGNDRINNDGSQTYIDGGNGDDYIQNNGWDWDNEAPLTEMTINAGAGNDYITNSGIQVSINAGAGDDSIDTYGEEVTITSGAGKDTISIGMEEIDTTITDFDAQDVLVWNGDTPLPTFARFKNNVLNIDGLKINLPNVTNIKNYRSMVIKGWGSKTITLGELLDEKTPYWKISGTTATYYSVKGEVISVLTGLKSGLSVSDGEIDGIDVYRNSFTLSSKVLGTTEVELENRAGYYELALADDARAEFDYTGWTYDSGSSAYKYQYKTTSAGYKVSAKGKKISVLKVNKVYDSAVVKGLKTGLTIKSDGNIDGIEVENVSDDFGRVFFDDRTLISGNTVTVEGEDRDLIFRDHGNYSGKTLKGGDGNDALYIEGSGAVLSSGKGNDFIGVYHSGNTIEAGEGDDEILNQQSDNLIKTGAGNDSIYNEWDWCGEDGQPENVSINAGAGDDFIVEYNRNTTVTLGAGVDTICISSMAQNLTITDLEAEDVLDFQFAPPFAKFKDGVLDMGVIKISLPNVTDIDEYRDLKISVDRTITTTLGDLLDVKTPYWKISGTTATYYSGNNEILATLKGLKSGLTVVDGEIDGIRLEGYGSNYVRLSDKVLDKKTVTITGDYFLGFDWDDEENYPEEFYFANKDFLGWTVSGTTATLQAKTSHSGYKISNNEKQIDYIEKNTTLDAAKISGLVSGTKANSDGSIDGIIVDGDWDNNARVRITSSAFKTKTLQVEGNYANFMFSDRDVDGDDYNGAIADYSGKTVKGGAGDDKLGFYTLKKVSVSAGKGDDVVEFVGVQNGTINAGDGDNRVELRSHGYGIGYNEEEDWYEEWVEIPSENNTVTTGAGKDNVGLFDGTGNKVSTGGGNDRVLLARENKVKVDTGAGNDTLEVASGTLTTNSTLLAGAGNDYINVASFSQGVLNGGAGNDTITSYNPYYDEESSDVWVVHSTISGGTGNDEISVNGERNLFKYADGDGNDTIIGFGSSDTLHISKGSIKDKYVDGDDFIITVGTGSIRFKNVVGSKLKIKVGSSKVTEIDTDVDNLPKWKISGTTATYGTSKTTLITVKNLKSGASVDDISLDGSVVTLSKNALGTDSKKSVTISSGYTLALADGVDVSEVSNAAWTIKDTKATYTGDRSAGYILAADGKSITYSAALKGKTLSTITGLKKGATVDDISMNDSTVTLSENALGTGTAKITGDYTLALPDGIDIPQSLDDGWFSSGTTAYYKTERKSAGYTLAANKKSISYMKESGKNSITVTGVKKDADVAGISLDGSVVTLSKDVLGTSKITISSGYTLALGEGVAAPGSTLEDGWLISGTTAYYKINRKSAGYTLAKDAKSISYTAEKNKNSAIITGLKKGTTEESLSLSDKVVTISAAALGTSKVEISSGYKLAFADDIISEPIKTAAGWTADDTTAVYKSAHTSESYALSSNKRNITYKKASGGSELVNLSGLASGTTSDNLSENVLVSGKVVSIEDSSVIGADGVSVKGSAAGYKFLLSEAGKLINIGAAATLKGSGENDSLIGGAGKDSIWGNAGDDYLDGGAGADRIYGGDGDDTLGGGTGNDTLTGGAGKDFFVYGGGKDVITDYAAGTDTIKISGTISKTKTSGKDIIYTIGSGTLTVKNGKGKEISIEDSTSALWAEDNFATADSLSSIVENDLYSVGEFEIQNSDASTQENLITYAK